MRSVMKHSFAEVPRANIPRSSFNRSCGNKITMDADYLVFTIQRRKCIKVLLSFKRMVRRCAGLKMRVIIRRVR